MNDVREIVKKTVFGDRWRSWGAVVFFLGAGLLFTGLALSESTWNQDIWAAFVMGVICLPFGVYFIYRARRLPAIAARVGDLVTTHVDELAWIYEVEVRLRQGKVWNVMVWTAQGETYRLALYRQETRDTLWTALQASAPHAFAPYSKARERELKEIRRSASRSGTAASASHPRPAA